MDVTRIVTAIHHRGRIRAFVRGKSLHSHLIRHGSLNDVLIANNLIAMCIDFSFLNDAQPLFEELLHRTVVTWTPAYTNLESPHTALRLYTHMLETQSETPNGFLYYAVLRACGIVGDLEMGRAIQGDISRDELEFDRYSKESDMVEAKNLLQQMLEPDVVSWNSLLAGFATKGSHFALGLVSMITRKASSFDVFALACALKTCGCLRLLAMGKQVHCYVIKAGFERYSYTLSALTDMYANCSELDEAIKLFAKYLSCKSSSHDSLAIWNSMFSGYVVNEQYDAAIVMVAQIHSFGTRCVNVRSNLFAFWLFNDMIRLGKEVDQFVIKSILKACASLAEHGSGQQIHAFIMCQDWLRI
ncbi:pentatricopeptide repeat-containing protein At4g08210-like [Cornus florida]|uniref:pentatricopeptide repeat-containing protein At4g08210-like n=1 Tax=Cornus florida TaxID=4283 RepID=UPI00289E7165|nr:pentatricopeptide repeat-containing protein At4g08210-like [Cornus florida]